MNKAARFGQYFLWISLTASLLAGCHKANQPPNPDLNTTATASTTPNALDAQTLELVQSDLIIAKAERYQPSVPVTGTIEAVNRSEVQSTVNARVLAIYTDVGETVKQGDKLISLDNRSSQDTLAQAQADVAAAKAQATVAQSLAQKNQRLYDQGFLSQVEAQQSQAQATAQTEALKAREAQLNAAKRLSADTIITAPTAGTVVSRQVKVGQIVAPNQPLLSIIDPNKLEFAANVPAEAQSQLSVGQHVPFTVASSPTRYVGQISRIAPQADAATRQLTVYISVQPTQSGELPKAGMFASGHVDYGQIQTGVLLPIAALQSDTPAPASAAASTTTPLLTGTVQSTAWVWVVGQDQRLKRQVVHIIRQDGASAQALVSGIEQGTMVVLAALKDSDAGKKAVLK